MLSDKEKKALERIDYIQDFIIENGQYNADVNDMEYFSRIKNLIEKQSKEIEELTLDLEEMTKSNNHKKENWVHKSILNSYISKDKIKAKIEELENQKRQWIEDRDNKHKDSEIIYAIEVLQSLLEKE